MSNITPYRFARDINGYQDILTLPVSNLAYTVGLTANLAQSFITPSDCSYYILVFGYPATTAIWVAIGTTAVIPAAPSINLGSSILTPLRLEVPKNTVVSMIAGATVRFGVRVYSDTNF